MEGITAWSLNVTDEELRLASEAIGEEIIRRERRRASAERHGLSAKNRRVLMCPRCGGKLRRNGKKPQLQGIIQKKLRLETVNASTTCTYIMQNNPMPLISAKLWRQRKIFGRDMVKIGYAVVDKNVNI